MLSSEQIEQHLRKSQFLETASNELIQELAGVVDIMAVKAGERLFDKGEIGSAMFFVIDGCVRVHDGEVVLTYLRAGQVFGEIGALAAQERTASVTVEMDSTLLKLDQEALYRVLGKLPDAAKTVIQSLCYRQSTLIYDMTDHAVKVKLLERELEIGQSIQKSFLPELVPKVAGWELSGFLQPAREVAGDFYDFFVVPTPRCIGIVIGDVCDKGVGAALFMTLFRSLIRSSSLYRNFIGGDAASSNVVSVLRDSIALTNKYIATTHGNSSMFSSVFFALLVPETGQLCYINAGHEAPVIIGAKGIRQELGPTGPVIGLFPDAEHEIGTAEILSGEVLFAYTDGLTDAKNDAGEQFSEVNALAVAEKCPRNADAMLRKVISEVEAFIGDAPQYDDITVITVYREGPRCT